MPSSVNLPLIGNVPKPALIIGGIGGAGVLGYIWYKHKIAAAAPSDAYGYGASAYGTG